MTAYWTGKKRGPMSQEWKDKISKSNKDFYSTHEHHQKFRPSPMFGKKHSEETKKYWSEIRRGRNISDDHKKKLSVAGIGKKPSERMLKVLRSRIGPLNPAWKGGIAQPEHSKKRKQRLKLAPGSHTKHEWNLLKIQYGFTCPCCKRNEPEIKLVKDHIIPLVKGGSNFIENIQPLCQPCNIKKFTKTIKYLLIEEEI